MAKCTAMSKRTGEQCRSNAVDGYTVCRMHGAGSPHKGRAGGGDGRPIITGRYSIKRTALLEKSKSFLNDANPADLTSELALMRTLLQDYLDRFDDDKRFPFDDIQRIFGMVEAIVRTVDKITKAENATALTQAEVQYLQARIVDLIAIYVPDPSKRVQFFADLASSFGDGREYEAAGFIEAER